MRIHQKKAPSSVSVIPNIHPVLQRIYQLRNITDAKELNLELKELLPFNNLTDINKACLRLETALKEQQKILIIGDFDADGATSTALAVSALQTFGAKNINYLVPNRFEYGYGLTKDIVLVAKKQFSPDLIVTVDNGIASNDGVLEASNLGIDVIVTDHHLPGEVLPNAHAIVNPNQHKCEFASKSIAGVGVIFYLMIALRRHLESAGWFLEKNIPTPNMSQFLDLVALGTVADVVALDQNNRILVRQGVLRIKKGLVRPGIKALLSVAKRDMQNIQASDLGFAIAPRLNAAGRLDDMSLGIACLLSSDFDSAIKIAFELDELNTQRRKIEEEMKGQAFEILNTLSFNDKGHMPAALCLASNNWHQGVIGILAGRLKDKYHRPTIIFAKGDDFELKGSARSVAGLNIRDILADINKDYPNLIIKFGGHAMAAGLTIRSDNFDEFKDVFVNLVAKHINVELGLDDVYSDGSLSESDLNLELALLLQDAGPWGSQFPEPCFDNIFEILDQKLVGKNHLKLTLALLDTYEPIDAIMFNIDLNVWPNHRVNYIHALYKLDINTYKGQSKLQLIIDKVNIDVKVETIAV